MRLIIQPDYQSVSQWAALYVAAKIKAANPTAEKPFVLGNNEEAWAQNRRAVTVISSVK